MCICVNTIYRAYAVYREADYIRFCYKTRLPLNMREQSAFRSAHNALLMKLLVNALTCALRGEQKAHAIMLAISLADIWRRFKRFRIIYIDLLVGFVCFASHAY